MRHLRAAVLAAFALVGCEATRQIGGDVAYQINPFGSTDLTVHSVAVHGPYLLVELAGRRESARFLAATRDGACVSLLVPEARLVYEKWGTFGRVSAGGIRCDLYGVASMEVWRDRQPRRRGLVPRSGAGFTLLARDDAYFLVRGRFALASKVSIPGAYDLVALLPNDPVCTEVVERGEASLEFRPTGASVYRLMSGNSFCLVEGFAMPVGP